MHMFSMSGMQKKCSKQAAAERKLYTYAHAAEKKYSYAHERVKLVNTCHPNSIRNMFVFSVFEASDTITNFLVALERYKCQVQVLETETWR